MRRPLVAIFALLAGVFAQSAAAQQPAAATPQPSASRPAAKWVAPRTPWGDPDLQGLWPSLDMQGTPLERPAGFGDRAVLTDQEFSAREEASQRQSEADAETTVVQRPRRGGGTGPPSHWGEHGVPTRQASLIVDPPDGRMPPMTGEGEQRAKMIHSTYFLASQTPSTRTHSSSSAISARTIDASREAHSRRCCRRVTTWARRSFRFQGSS